MEQQLPFSPIYGGSRMHVNHVLGAKIVHPMLRFERMSEEVIVHKAVALPSELAGPDQEVLFALQTCHVFGYI